MDGCANQPSWFEYFKENMAGLNLPVPTTWTGKGMGILGILQALANASERFGSRVTVSELIGAGTKAEAFFYIGSLSAAYYLGAAIGSAAVATGRYTSCGTQLMDVLAYSKVNKVSTPAIRNVLLKHPEIYNTSMTNRSHFRTLARV